MTISVSTNRKAPVLSPNKNTGAISKNTQKEVTAMSNSTAPDPQNVVALCASLSEDPANVTATDLTVIAQSVGVLPSELLSDFYPTPAASAAAPPAGWVEDRDEQAPGGHSGLFFGPDVQIAERVVIGQAWTTRNGLEFEVMSNGRDDLGLEDLQALRDGLTELLVSFGVGG